MKQIPNALTLSNLLMGCLSILASTSGDITWAGYFIIIGATADFLDGFAARLLKVSSELGAQLDSLSDLVSFGVAPGFIAFALLENEPYFKFLAFIIPLCASIRLAKFNLGGQSAAFSGIPSPACGMFWAATAIGGIAFLPETYQMPFLIAAILLTALLMVLPFYVLSFKFKNLSWGENKMRFVFILTALASILIFGWSSPLIILVLYLLCSFADKQLFKSHG